MAYEIPQQLAYKEQIVFGLTFRQLGYLFGFGLPILGLLKFTEHPSKWAITFVLVMLCASFMFLNLEEHMKNWYSFLSFREAFLLDKNMNQFLEIEKIEGGKIHVKNKN